MKSPLPDYLARLLDQCRGQHHGKVADYIPELAQANPDSIAVAICTSDGVVYTAGDADLAFSIQSISKPFAYALALEALGLEKVQEKVSVEPSGEAFNELSLEEDTGRPRNPMINAGAIATHALLPGQTPRARADALKQLLDTLAGRTLAYDEAVYASEMETAHRNMALAHMLRSVGIIDAEPRHIVEGYTRQCAIRVTVQDLARMAAAVANKGALPGGGDRVLSQATARQVLSVMTSCGMYDAAGDWLTSVGIPAKSGVSGGIMGALPGQLGVAVMSPGLDRYGNSLRGVRMMERLSRDMGLHIMEALQTPRSSLRNPQLQLRSDIDLFELRGDIHFAQAELLLRTLAQSERAHGPVILDISRVHEMSPIGRRILLDAVEGVHGDALWVALVDPHDRLPDARTPNGFAAPRFARLDEAIKAACDENPLSA